MSTGKHVKFISILFKIDTHTSQRMTFSIKDFFCKFDQITADLVTFTEEILTFHRFNEFQRTFVEQK